MLIKCEVKAASFCYAAKAWKETLRGNKTQSQNIILTLCLLFSANIEAQINLVPNPSFEQYTNCPFNRYFVEALNGKPDIWFKPDNRYASYFNSCSNDSINGGVPFHKLAGGNGFQNAKTGNGYILMRHFGSTMPYFEIKLFDSLKQNKKYYGECYVNCVNSNTTASNSQSMYFSKNATYVDTALYDTMLRNPQIYNYDNPIIVDTLNWVKVSGVFTAQGGEQYLTLGNFRNSYTVTKRIKLQNTGFNGAGYYYDDIAVYNLDSFCLKADAGRDTTIAVNDSVYIGSYTNGIDTIKWYNAAGQIIDSSRPGFIIHPTNTGTTMYIVEQTINGCTTRDTVNINIVLPLKFISYNLVPSLRGTKQSVENLWTTANEINVSHYNIQRSINAKDFTTIGTVRANNKSYNEYEFIDDLKTKDQDLKTLYYRIQAVDNDGKLTYSEVKTLNLKPSTLNSVSIFPNPAKDMVHIECKQGISKLLITDYLGREIATGTNLSNDGNLKLYTLNLKHLSKGVYLVKIVTNNGKIVAERLIIE